MYRTSILLFALFFFSCNNRTIPPKGVSVKTAVTDPLTDKLEAIYGKGNFAGFAVAAVTADGVLYQNGFGYADIEAGKKYTAQTTQPIASVSKTLIGIALLKAQELGKLDINDPINKYLPFRVRPWLFPESKITILQLATHTSSIHDTYRYMERSYVLDEASSGIPTGYPQAFDPRSSEVGFETFLQSLFSEKGEYYAEDNFTGLAPGQSYEYSNLGASIAALVLEKATGMSYDAFTKKYILEPLDMKDSGWYGRSAAGEGRSHLYSGKKEALPFYHCITYPDGGLVTSAADMAKYLQELIKGYQGKGKLLSKESYKQYFTTYLGPKSFIDGREENNPYSDEYNSGLFIGFSPRGYIGHTGGDPGVSTLMFFDPETGVGRFFMINTDIDDKPGNDAFYAIWDALGTLDKGNKK